MDLGKPNQEKNFIEEKKYIYYNKYYLQYKCIKKQRWILFVNIFLKSCYKCDYKYNKN